MNVAGKLKAWAKKRLDRALGEKSDYYQTKAAYELRELEYITAQQQEKSAARAYNSLRGIDSDVVTEELAPPKPPVFNKKEFSEKIWRDDVRAASKQSAAAKANSLLGKERNRPTLDIYGKYAWTGLDADKSTAMDESMSDNHPTYTVGVKFVVPLAFGKANDVTSGYQKEALAADLSFKRKAQEQKRDYDDLISEIESANAKFKLAATLEESQRIKVQAERKRHNTGRTTFFQVLQFEQDYLESQLNKISTEAELHALLTQLQMYREE
jgi:outer membrane protein TolC